MNCNDIPQYEINRIFLNLYTEEERNQQLDTKLKMLFKSDEDAIRMYRLNMALNRIRENERIRLQLLAQRRALFGKRKRNPNPNPNQTYSCPHIFISSHFIL